MHLSPPSAFATVMDGIFRSNAPSDENLPFLSRLRLRSVVHLSPDVLLKSVVAFFAQNNIQVFHLGAQSWHEGVSWTQVDADLMKNALEIALSTENQPSLICCTSGIYQTGVVVGCLRRIQGWTMSSALEEYRTFSGSKARSSHEQFIELFDVDVVNLPKSKPLWFSADEEITLEEEKELETEDDPEKLEFLKMCMNVHYGLLVSSSDQYTSTSLVEDEDDD